MIRTLRYSCLLCAVGLAVLFGVSVAQLWSFDLGPTTSLAAAPAIPPDGTENLPPGAVIETVLSNMDRPVAMAFDPSGRLFYTERVSGRVRLFENGVLQASAVITLPVDTLSERGLLGIAVDPNFADNHYIYVYHTCPTTTCGTLQNRVVRFVENNGVGGSATPVFTSPQTAGNHNGGNIHFGPDGKLYISVGDNANAANSQNVGVPNGKMHRINPDGTIPPDNPVFTQTGRLPSLYAMGLRNSFDFAFDPLTPPTPYHRIFASENGPSCDDEMNRIEAAYNYGWRASYPCDDNNPSPEYNTIRPLWWLGTEGGGACCEAPTGIVVYTGTQVPQWTGHLFMSNYNTGRLRHFYLDGTRTQVLTTNYLLGVTSNMDLENGPDGALWYMQGGGYTTGTLRRITGSTPTATPTATPQATPYLVGHVTWQGPPSQPNALQQLPITLTLKSGAAEMNYPAQSTDASGFFTVPVGSLPTGTYQLRVKGPQYLANSGEVTLTGVTQTNQEMGTMRAGDCNNDNVVSSPDFSILRATFGLGAGDPGYDDRADFTGDNLVNVQDFTLLRANFGLGGAPPLQPRR